ncbi:MAG: methylmalonyl-CoA epimerase [Calditrichaceae bacterium]|jgi:methylmalonyl-CoA/ethylmalonyl-CoA epimerase
MITQLNHIGIAVRSLEEHIEFYRDVLKLKFEGIETIPDQKVRTAIFKAGDVRIELLEPTDTGSPVNKFLDKKGEGLHHIAYQTDNIENEIKELKQSNIKMIDESPKPGAHNTSIAFLHPHSTGRVLTEICQHK